MPLYMDRHDIPGVNAKSVAEAHQQDLKNQEKHNCKALTYWFDELKGLAFCLVEAPSKEAVEELHRDSHGLIPNQIIDVGADIVELFLGRISDPETTQKLKEFEHYINESASRTILYMKISFNFFSNAKLNFKDRSNLFNSVNKLVRKKIEHYQGREIKSDTSEFITSFKSISKAMECGFNLQKELVHYKKQNYQNIFDLSIGVCIGEPVTDKAELFGESLKLAKRLCYISTGNEIVASSNVKNAFIEKESDFSNNIQMKSLNEKEEIFLTQLMDLIEKEWDRESFNIEQFSRKIGLSQAQLYRKVKSLIGCSLNEFIRDYRLNEAIKLLEKQNKNISEIAFETGFNNASYFSKCFQNKFGILPSEYIKV